ncbi:MAG: hypothetical protein RJB47_1848 [Pseudomonadota bacterium]
MLVFKYAIHDKYFFASKMPMRVEESAGRPADQGCMGGAIVCKRHHREPWNQSLMPLG